MCAASRTATSRQPALVITSAPSGTSGERDSTTLPTAPPCIVSPISHGAAYDGPSRIRPRMYGSTDMASIRTTTCPSAGAGRSRSPRGKSPGGGGPLEFHQAEGAGGGLAVRPGGELPFTRGDHAPILHSGPPIGFPGSP